MIRVDPKTKSRKIFDIKSPPHERLILNNVFALEEDDNGRIWIGTAGGINVWDEKEKQMHAITSNAANGLTSNYIARFVKSADGSIWVSAWEGGLFKIVSGFQTLNNIRFEYIGDFPSDKITYASNAVWAIHHNELYRIDVNTYVTRKVETFNAVSKGRDLYTLFYSAKGSMWAERVKWFN